MAIFEPIALPTAKPPAPSNAAIVETNISGADVPNDTMVRPITNGEIPIKRAVAAAPSTKRSALQTRMTKPAKSAAMAGVRAVRVI